MTPLRQRLLEDLQLRGLSTKTPDADVRAVQQLAQSCNQSPEAIREDELRAYLLMQTGRFGPCRPEVSRPVHLPRGDQQPASGERGERPGDLLLHRFEDGAIPAVHPAGRRLHPPLPTTCAAEGLRQSGYYGFFSHGCRKRLAAVRPQLRQLSADAPAAPAARVAAASRPSRWLPQPHVRHWPMTRQRLVRLPLGPPPP